jgi:hypothetical protein
MQCKNAVKSTFLYLFALDDIRSGVFLEITGSCITSEVASKVMTVAWAEVLLADSIHVTHVTGACDVDLAPVDEFW